MISFHFEEGVWDQSIKFDWFGTTDPWSVRPNCELIIPLGHRHPPPIESRSRRLNHPIRLSAKRGREGGREPQLRSLSCREQSPHYFIEWPATKTDTLDRWAGIQFQIRDKKYKATDSLSTYGRGVDRRPCHFMKVSKVAEGIQVRKGRRENICKWPLGPFHSQIKSAVCSTAAAEGIYFSCKDTTGSDLSVTRFWT